MGFRLEYTTPMSERKMEHSCSLARIGYMSDACRVYFRTENSTVERAAENSNTESPDQRVGCKLNGVQKTITVLEPRDDWYRSLGICGQNDRLASHRS